MSRYFDVVVLSATPSMVHHGGGEEDRQVEEKGNRVRQVGGREEYEVEGKYSRMREINKVERGTNKMISENDGRHVKGHCKKTKD